LLQRRLDWAQQRGQAGQLPGYVQETSVTGSGVPGLSLRFAHQIVDGC
jgi:hypothetical protein